ncbi:MAG TPA: VWA domain-containing protein [Solibacterales bacterium]|nr:VWA domain-containing protein [Bryobacterales bacterium]
MNRRHFLGAFPIAVAARAWGQQKPAAQPPEDIGPIISVDVELVNLLFSVRDKRNGLVGNLTQEDFSVIENSAPQTIKYFTRETDLPLTIGLLVDVSRSQENLIETERRAALQFFSQVLRQKDMAFLISFGVETELLQDYTNSSKLLRAGLDKLQVRGGTTLPGINPGPIPTSGQRGTVMFEAVYLAANDMLRGQVGRKAMILITDGVDVGSRTKIGEALEAAQKADSIIYSIEFSDPRYTGFGYGGGGGDLKRLSEETGGRLFRVSRGNPLESIFSDIQQEMRSQYSIGYTPTNPAKDGSFRKVEIKTKNKDLKVQARKGYYASGKEG